ncbi:MAG: hypothetical protein IIA85_01050 [Nanoarchaeota archaeon]|nr:hypothetical protein [Nanoarchaeota archaeon]
MVESKFPPCYSNISFDIYNLIKDISIELRRDSPVKIGISLTHPYSIELKGGLNK